MMQSAAASRRAFSALASKIHPQLPLSPRESQQLLSLLTTSFRAHLDREHPVAVPGGNRKTQLARKQPLKSSPNPRAESSYGSAHQHIDSVLSNPLFSRKPRRRMSDSAAVDILKHPLSWFLDQLAIGAADIPKAQMCLEAIHRTPGSPRYVRKSKRGLATVVADWLQSSGLENSTDFVNMVNLDQSGPRRFFNILLPMLFAEGNLAPMWRWFTRLPEHRMGETGLDADRITSFRARLLRDMVFHAQLSSRDEAFAIFLKAYHMYRNEEHGLVLKVIQPAGAGLVNSIMNEPQLSSSPELYEAFMHTSTGWLSSWSTAVTSMLRLFHPTKPSAQPGLAYIRDRTHGAETHVNSSMSRRQFLVQLCLGVARQFLEEGKFSEAQIAMNFTKDHFAEMVLSETSGVDNEEVETHSRAQKEKENLEMLDRLLPT